MFDRLTPGLILTLTLTLLIADTAQAQMEDVEIKATPVTASITMLEGAGGNLAACVGEDGVFLIDDQFAPLTEKILAAIAEIDERSVSFVLNTHWHGDHVGGNENMGEAGALVVSHENVRARMSQEHISEFLDRTTPPANPGALPVVTFDSEVNFFLNGEEIHVFHVEHAHTDGDAIVHFVNANVIHAGDVVFYGLYPFIDTESGGSINGMIAATERILALSNAKTKIIPGHGPLLERAHVQEFLGIITSIRDNIAALVDQGLTLEEAKAAKPTAKWDDTWGKLWLTGDQIVELVYGDLKSEQP